MGTARNIWHKDRVTLKRNVKPNWKKAKQGAIIEDFNDEYKSISKEINELKKAKLRFVQEKTGRKI